MISITNKIVMLSQYCRNIIPKSQYCRNIIFESTYDSTYDSRWDSRWDSTVDSTVDSRLNSKLLWSGFLDSAIIWSCFSKFARRRRKIENCGFYTHFVGKFLIFTSFFGSFSSTPNLGLNPSWEVLAPTPTVDPSLIELLFNLRSKTAWLLSQCKQWVKHRVISSSRLVTALELYWHQNGTERSISGDKRRYPVHKRW